jgi:putative transposase
MPLISLEPGLVVRRGARTLEFVRLLPGNKVQFEDQITRQVQTMHLSRFYSGVLCKQLVPILAQDALASDPTIAERAPVLVTDLSSLDEPNKKLLERRMKYVKAIRKRQITRGQRSRLGEVLPSIAVELKDDKPPSVSTVLGWMRRFELSSMNPAALLSGNRTRRRRRDIHPSIEDLIIRKLKSVYLTKARHTMRHAMEQIHIEAAKMVRAGKVPAEQAKVSVATVNRRLGEFPRYDVLRARYGLNHARADFRTTVEGVLAVRSMQRLECDHTPLNWVVLCDRTGLPLGRPTLTIIVDSLSGYVVGIYVSFYGPGLTSVLNVLKNAILPKDDLVAAAGCSQPWIAFGIGETILLDNGLEFHSPQFQLAGWELGMDIEYCRVRMPWLKPMVERFFANLDHLSLKTGRVYKPMANVQHLDPMKDAAITFSDFAKGLLKFVVDVYPFELNNRRLQTAYDCFKEGLDLLPPPAFPTSFDQLDLIAAMSKTLTVAQGGIEMVGLNYSSPELAQLKRSVGAKFKTLVKWNPDDLSFVYMQDPRNQQWMPVPSVCGDYTNGLSWIQHRLIRQHARDKHVQGGTYERLVRARQELHECWMNPLVRRNRRAPDAVRHCDGTGLQLTFATADGHLAAAHKNGPHQRFSK